MSVFLLSVSINIFFLSLSVPDPHIFIAFLLFSTFLVCVHTRYYFNSLYPSELGIYVYDYISTHAHLLIMAHPFCYRNVFVNIRLDFSRFSLAHYVVIEIKCMMWSLSAVKFFNHYKAQKILKPPTFHLHHT